MRFLTGRGSKAKRNSIPVPPEEKSLNGEDPNEELGSKIKTMGFDGGRRSTEFGSKDETFFESSQSLGSDWEDDFFSVNGDFTPSRGNTPNHQIMTPRRSQPNKASIVAIPTDKKLKLSELLQEKEEDEQERINHDNINCMEKINNAEYREVSPNIDMKQKKEKSLKSKQCCLPTFARRRGETVHKHTQE